MRDVHQDAGAQAELDALGLEVLPVVVRGDRRLVVAHPQQLVEFFGLPPEDRTAEWTDLVDAAERVLLAFERLLTQLPEDRIHDPTPNRGRDMRNMTINVFGLMEELIHCMDSCQFSYQAHKDHDATYVEYASVRQLREYAAQARERWVARARRVGPDEVDAYVTTDRKGDVTQYLALDSGARHAAGHLRQAYQFLRDIGIAPMDELTVEQMRPIQVQTSLY